MIKEDFDILEINCKQRVINELAFNNLLFKDLLCELIDNVVAELTYCKTATVHVNIGGPWVTIGKSRQLDREKSFFEIEDNATGIESTRLAECLELAGTSGKYDRSLHEHGEGMKRAIVSIGKNLKFLKTKHKNDDFSSEINQLVVNGKVKRIKDYSPSNIGTKIRIEDLFTKVPSRYEDYALLIPWLGAKYSKLLSGSNKMKGQKLEIIFTLFDEKENIYTTGNGQEARWIVKPCEPYYRMDELAIDNPLKGDGWAAHLQFGWAAKEEQYKSNDMEVPGPKHPYRLSNSTIDVDMYDRMLCRLDPQDLDVGVYKFYNYHGKLILLDGFKTSSSKDGVYEDNNWQELLLQVKKLVKQEIEAEVNRNKDTIRSESECRDYLYNRWTNEDYEVKKEYSLDGVGGNVDIAVKINDKWEVRELKAEQANGLHVYQVLYYLDMWKEAKKDTAWLIAPSFSEGAFETASRVMNEKNINVKLKTFEDIGLTTPRPSKHRKKSIL